MPWLNHHARKGFTPYQDHRPGYDNDVKMSYRAVEYGARVIEQDNTGGWLVEEETVGDHNGAYLFKAAGQKRPIGGWSYAWASMVESSAGGGSATVTEDSLHKSTGGIQVDFRSGGTFFNTDPIDFSGFSGVGVAVNGKPLSGGSRLGNSSAAKARIRGSYPHKALPIIDAGGVGGEIHTFDPTAQGAFPTSFSSSPKKFLPDSRFKADTFQFDGPWPKFLPRTPGIVTSAVNEGKQAGVFLPTDPRLIAPHMGRDATVASLVCDVGASAIDATRTARLHTYFRVIQSPFATSGIPFGDNILAQQYAKTDIDQVGTYGAIYDEGDQRRGEVTPRLDAGESYYHGRGSSAPSSFTNAVFGFLQDLLSGINASRPPVGPIATGEVFTGGGARAIGLMSHPGAAGPIHVGSENDTHRHGVDGDGNTINAAHLSTLSYFRVPGAPPNAFDGPFTFVTAEYTGSLYPLTTHCEIRWDSKATHPFLGQTRPGRWHIQGTAPLGGSSSPPKKTPTTTPSTPSKPPTTPPVGPPVAPPSLPPVTTPANPFPSGGNSAPGMGGGGTSLAVMSRPVNPSHLSSYSPRNESAAVALSPFGPGEAGRGYEPPSTSRNVPFVVKPGSMRTTRLTGTWEASDAPEDDLHTFQVTGFPAILGRPPSVYAAHPNLRSAPGVAAHQFSFAEQTTPVSIRIEAFAKQYIGGEWAYAQRPNLGRYAGGTAPGGFVLLPPELSIDDYARDFSVPNLTPSTTYFVAGPGVYFASGYPVPSTGGVKTGWRWYSNSAGKLFFESLDSAGTATEWFSILASGVTHLKGGLHETATISPAQLVANTDNWSPTGLATTRTIRVSTDASRDLTGIDITVFDTPQGVRIRLVNVGSQNLVLKNNTTSNPANRFSIGADLTVAGGGTVDLWYDSTDTRWRLAG